MKARFDIVSGFSCPPGENALFLHFSEQGSLLLDSTGSVLGGSAQPASGEAIYVAHYQARPVYALRTDTENEASLLGLRELAVSDEPAFALAGRAKQLIEWRETHRFCSKCGEPTDAQAQENAMRCHSCGTNYYPRLMPCVMALVVRGEYCLLAKHRHRNQWWTTLAGFVEAGESLEQAIYREVLEEVSLEPLWSRYLCSQSWPFPGQLMAGFCVGCSEGDPVPEQAELEDVRWFHRDSLPIIPPSFTLSGKLIGLFASGALDSDNHSQGA